MTTTTIDHRPLPVTTSLIRLTVVVLFALALVVAAFATGRASAPEHTAKPAVASQTAADYPCRLGRAC
jgi:hypothetical protein